MKKCIVISDSFKGTVSSLEICEIAKQSIPRFFPECEVIALPVADGGEGTVECFVKGINAEPVTVSATGPLGAPLDAVYARHGNQAIVEMASVAGLPLLNNRLDPMNATTFGVGQLIRHAIENGCTEILLGLGGSCTNDGGCGCAAALGVKFYDEDNNSFIPTGGTLSKICKIDCKDAKELLKGVQITVMCDVENPLYGPTGAAYVFGPQKGADEKMVREIDSGLRRMSEVVETELGKAVAQIPGAGAAGGMGAGCIAFLNAKLKSGIDAVLDMVEFDHRIEGADLVITGEGRIDSQSVHGKVISGIVKRTRVKNIPLMAIVGSIHPSAAEAYDLGVTAMFGIDREAVAFEKYADRSAENYRQTLEDILRLLKAMKERWQK
ncbi:glycerate kinase family protein [Succinatimonas hippei]|uniref:glycerate kinase family protein n=1 Tax=Succinatimonas hippei TaxID=626938 RepID=UPI00248FECD7|nr:glycerate kinase [Succinatimonas hippei]